jgi:hypothetical protein
VILPFKELKEYHNKLVSELSVDKRLYQDPDCRKDLPFDRILSIEGTAILDSVVRATIVTHAVDVSLKMIPLLSNVKWKSKNYDSMVEGILFKKMKHEMLYEVGRFRTNTNKKIRRHRHWNLFLEQTVQAFKRQVELGLITPTEEEAQALNACDKVKLFYKYPDRQAIRDLRNGEKKFTIDDVSKIKDFKLDQDAYEDPIMFYKWSMVYDKINEEAYKNSSDYNDEDFKFPKVTRLKKFRMQTKVFAVRTMQKYTKVLFKRIASQEVNRLLTKMAEVIEPQIESLDLFLFSKDKLFLGSSLSIGDLDSEKRYTQGERNSLGQIVEPSITKLITNLGLTEKQKDIMNEVGAFVVERYIKTGPRKQSFPAPVPPAINGVTTLFDFRNFIGSSFDPPQLEKPMSEYFAEPCKFGIRISYIFNDDNKEIFKDVIKTGENGVDFNKSYYAEERSILPLASFTYDFVDETFGQFVDPNLSKNNYDTQCLVRNLIKTDEFVELFHNIFPYKAPISLVGAFLYSGFYGSIGHKDGWDTKRAEADVDAFNNLEDESLKGTKKLLQKAFESVYVDQDFDQQMEDSKEFNLSLFGSLKSLIPKFKISLGKYGRRVVEDLDDCDDPVFKFLRE